MRLLIQDVAICLASRGRCLARHHYAIVLMLSTTSYITSIAVTWMFLEDIIMIRESSQRTSRGHLIHVTEDIIVIAKTWCVMCCVIYEHVLQDMSIDILQSTQITS